jgi:predicted ABC-type ATPase
VRDIIVIGGPNGAGKTTVAQVLLPEELSLLEFVNADNIALGLSPFNPEGVAVAAGRVMLDRMNDLVRSGTSFAFETTCAGRGHVRFLKACQSEGWRVTLIFVWLDDPRIAIRRVAQRVREGGHNIPTDVIIRRYQSGLRNMRDLYLPLADTAYILDNSLGDEYLVAEKSRITGLVVHDHGRWARIQEAAA